MKLKDQTHTTNYFNTLIVIAADSKTAQGIIPVLKNDKKTIAFLQFELIAQNPYKFTSDDVLFQVFAFRNDLIASEYQQARNQFFSKGQACFRASPLTKQYGWGVHFNDEGKIAIYDGSSEEYQSLLDNPLVAKVRAMQNSKKTITDR